MSNEFEQELDLEPVGQESVESVGSLESDDSVESVDSLSASETDSSEIAEDAESEEKQSLVNSFLTMGIYNAMLLLSLIFIFVATLNMLGVLRTYNGSFPFGGGFPWSTNL